MTIRGIAARLDTLAGLERNVSPHKLRHFLLP